MEEVRAASAAQHEAPAAGLWGHEQLQLSGPQSMDNPNLSVGQINT